MNPTVRRFLFKNVWVVVLVYAVASSIAMMVLDARYRRSISPPPEVGSINWAAGLLEYHGFQVIRHETGEIEVVGLSVDPRRITERVLYGTWVNITTIDGESYGFQFTPTVTYGPYTFVRTGFEGDQISVLVGFFEINFDGYLILHYRERRDIDDVDGSGEPWEATQRWSLRFITQDILELVNGDVTMVLQRVAITVE
jgi:hypothetical protein